MKKLNQVIAIEADLKGKINKLLTETDRASTHPELFNGFVRTYYPRDEEGEELPPETRLIQQNVNENLEVLHGGLVEFYDTVATKDWTNCHATANVVVDGKNLIENAPVPFLLFLEKQLVDLRTLVSRLPETDPSDEWVWDDQEEVFRTDPTEVIKTKKVQKPIVLYDATEQHPAQTQLITEDVAVGVWRTTRKSGAISPARKRQLLDRINELSKATKIAREEANSSEVTKKEIGENILNYIFD